MFEREIHTPKIAKDFLEKIAKLQDEDASSDEAKKFSKLEEQLKAAPPIPRNVPKIIWLRSAVAPHALSMLPAKANRSVAFLRQGVPPS